MNDTVMPSRKDPCRNAVLLLTGKPGAGKTTAIRKLAALLPGRALGGFFTGEVRRDGVRQGFRVEAFGGRAGRLAEAGLRSPHRVGRYGVDLEDFEAVALPALELEPSGRGFDLFLVDEIGKMECFSPRFVAATRALLDSGRPVVATVALRGEGFIAEVKRRPGAELWELTPGNRDAMPERLWTWLQE